MHPRLLSLLFTLLLCTGGRAQRIERVEPPNWWIGFEATELQLLVYGKDISGLTVTVDWPGLTLQSTTRTGNPNYLFVNLNIAADAKAGIVPMRFTNDAGFALTHQYDLAQKSTEVRQGFTTADVMYLITPDRFVNGDPTNDVVAGLRENMVDRKNPGGRHGGDIAGIMGKLDYLADLGVGSLWLNPVLENDMAEYSYHGYSTTDYYKVDPRYGSNESYRALSNAAAAKGIKLIKDIIPNHCGSNHWFVLDPPTADWINFGGKFVGTNHKRTTVQDPHAAEIDTRRHADGWFVATMPDLNQRNDLLARYLTQNAIWWIEYASLGGVRVDTYPYPDKYFMGEWTKAIMREYPAMSIVGEEWSNEPAIVSYWQAGKVNHDGYVSYLPQLMDFPIQEAVRDALTEAEDWGKGFLRIYETLAMDFLYADYNKLVVFPDNHDMDRIFTQLGEDVDLWKMAMGYHLTTRGIPQIYYGTEILMSNAAVPGDHGVIRSDFPGGWAGDATNGFTGQGLTTEQLEAKAWLKKLMNWRQQANVIHTGKLMQFTPQDGVYAYFRYNDDEKVMVVMNKNEAPVDIDMARFAEILDTNATAKDILTDTRYPMQDGLKLPRKGIYVLAID
jgi:glycosidase